MSNNNLTVSSHDQHTIKTIDIVNGAIKTVRHVGGKIISGPIISGDTVSVTVEEPQGQSTKIYKLPNLNLILVRN